MNAQWPAMDCLGVQVGQPAWAELKDWFYASAHRGKLKGAARSLYIVNAHALNIAYGEPRFRAVLNRSDVVLNDGVGLDVYAKLARESFRYNFNGTDLFPRLFSEAPSPLTVFLYGAVPGRAERAALNIEARYPNVRVVGTRHGYVKESVIDSVNEARPDLLLVGLGNPQQELWIDAHRDRLEVGVVAGIGALIDFLSGSIRRAPRLIRRARLEWAHRLALEPRRMFTRYAVGNPVFVARSVHYLATGRGRSRD